MNKKFIIFTLFVGLSIGLTGCGSGLKFFVKVEEHQSSEMIVEDEFPGQTTSYRSNYKMEKDLLNVEGDNLSEAAKAAFKTELEQVVDALEGSVDITSVLKSYESLYTLEYIYYCAAADGVLTIEPKAELPEDYDGRERPWYKGVVESKDIYSTIYIDVVDDSLILSIALPVMVGDQLQGVLGADYKIGVKK